MDVQLQSIIFPCRVAWHAAPRTSRGEAACAARRARIRAYVDAEMADPDLSAQAAAKALGMSVRGLHLALAPTGESFGKLLQRHRVAACQAVLSRSHGGATIADIAFEYGFSSLSSFYRAFRRVYGAPPRETTQKRHRLENCSPPA